MYYFPCAAPAETAALCKELDEASQAHKRAEEAEEKATKQLDKALSSKHDLEAALQQEREAFYVLRNDLAENKDRRGLLQLDLDAAENKLVQQAEAAREVEQKVARLQRESEEAAAQQNCRNLEAASKGMRLHIVSGFLHLF